MDILTFIASITGTLAWPITTLIALVVFIKKGSQIARVIKSIRYKDFELNLREDFAAAKEIVYQIQTEDQSNKSLSSSSMDELYQLANIDPSLAIFKTWQKLEAKITQLIQHNGLIRFTNPRKFIVRLLELEKITKDEVELFSRLQHIRNNVVHPSHSGKEPKLTIAEVVEYKDFVDTFIERLEAIRQEDGYINVS